MSPSARWLVVGVVASGLVLFMTLCGSATEESNPSANAGGPRVVAGNERQRERVQPEIEPARPDAAGEQNGPWTTIPVAGIVIDADGRPAPMGTTVAFRMVGRASSDPLHEVRTATEGRFTGVVRVPVDSGAIDYAASVVAEAWAAAGDQCGVSTVRRVDDLRGGWWVEIRLRSSMRLRLRAVDPSGNAVAATQLLVRTRPRDGLQGWEYGLNAERPRILITNDDGTAECVLPKGPAVAAARRVGAAFGLWTQVGEDSEEVVDVVLPVEAWACDVRLSGANGEPVIGAMLTTESEEFGQVLVGGDGTVAQGPHRSDGLGQVRLRFAHNDRPLLLGVAHPEFQTAAVVIDRSDAPAARLHVELKPRRRLEVSVDQLSEAGTPTMLGVASIASADPLSSSTIPHGTATHAFGASPVPERRARRVHPALMAEWHARRNAAVPLRNGRAELTIARPHAARVRISIPGVPTMIRTLDFADASTPLHQSFQFPGGKLVRLRYDGDARPAASARLTLTSTSGKSVSVPLAPAGNPRVDAIWFPDDAASVRLDQIDGTLRSTHVPLSEPQQGTITVGTPAGALADGRASLTRLVVELALDGRPVIAPGFRARISGTHRDGTRWTMTETAGQSGRIEVDVPPGEIAVRTVSAGGPPHSEKVNVAAGTQREHVTLALTD